jgi:hypothetical protein
MSFGDCSFTGGHIGIAQEMYQKVYKEYYINNTRHESKGEGPTTKWIRALPCGEKGPKTQTQAPPISIHHTSPLYKIEENHMMKLDSSRASMWAGEPMAQPRQGCLPSGPTTSRWPVPTISRRFWDASVHSMRRRVVLRLVWGSKGGIFLGHSLPPPPISRGPHSLTPHSTQEQEHSTLSFTPRLRP